MVRESKNNIDEEDRIARILGNILLVGSFLGVGLGLFGVLGSLDDHGWMEFGLEAWWSNPRTGLHFFGGLGVGVLSLVPVCALLVLGWMSAAKKNWSNLLSIAGLLVVMIIALISNLWA